MPKKIDWEPSKEKKQAEVDFKKHVSSKRNWDIRKMISSEVVEAVETLKDQSETGSKYVEKMPEQQQKASGLGPWIPVVSGPLSTTELQKNDAK